MLRSLDIGCLPLARVMCRAQEMKLCGITKLSSDQKGLPRVEVLDGRQYLMFDHEKGHDRFRPFLEQISVLWKTVEFNVFCQ